MIAQTKAGRLKSNFKLLITVLFRPSRFCFKYKVLNALDISSLAAKVTLSPNSSTPQHTHAGTFVEVHVFKGTLLKKINDPPMTIKKAGDSLFGAHGC
jgi:hypothetical protein